MRIRGLAASLLLAACAGPPRATPAPPAAPTATMDASAPSGELTPDARLADESVADARLPAEPVADARVIAVDASPARDAGTVADAAPVTAGPLQYLGRWNVQQGRATTVNTGSRVVAAFDGTGVTARFDVAANTGAKPTVAWQIDGGEWQEHEIAASLPLATGLAAGRHTVTLMARGMDETLNRWKAPLVSGLVFLGLDVAAGALGPAAAPAGPRIEFLGDSITEGYETVAPPAGHSGFAWATDGRQSFGAQTGTLLGADWRQVGFGAQGILAGGLGNVPPAPATFDWVYDGVPRDAWRADIAVINQGTNDGNAPSAAFSAGYARYLDIVRKGYPNAWIVAMRPFNGAHADDIAAVVAARVAAGDRKVMYVDTTGWLGAPGDLRDVHPTAAGDQKVRDRLAPVLRGLM